MWLVGHFRVAGLNALVAVSILRRSGGGEIAGEALRLAAPSAILRIRVRENVVGGLGIICSDAGIGRAEARELSRSHMFG